MRRCSVSSHVRALHRKPTFKSDLRRKVETTNHHDRQFTPSVNSSGESGGATIDGLAQHVVSSLVRVGLDSGVCGSCRIEGVSSTPSITREDSEQPSSSTWEAATKSVAALSARIPAIERSRADPPARVSPKTKRRCTSSFSGEEEAEHAYVEANETMRPLAWQRI